MKIGYYVQGAMDEAVVWGLAKRWCPLAGLAVGVFRGSSEESFRRELRKALLDLRDAQRCDVLVVLTDSDVNPWRDVRRREGEKVPDAFRHLCAFGVAERNVECWLAADRSQLAAELGCAIQEIPQDDPSGFVKKRFGVTERDDRRSAAKERVCDYVAGARLKAWIDSSDSFENFYEDVRRVGAHAGCGIPNERAAS